MAPTTRTTPAPSSTILGETVATPLDPSDDDGDSEERASEVLLALLTDDDDEPAPPIVVPERILGVVVGTVLALGPSGATIAWLGAPGGIPARVAAVLGPEHVGAEVAIAFELGDPTRPLVLGVMQRFEPAELDAAEQGCDPDAAEPRVVPGLRVEAVADGERVVLEADRELVLSCGKASITLTRAGKVLIRGTYVSSHSSGTQRIRGGTVEIN